MINSVEFDGHDYFILGLSLGMGSAILFAKAYLIPSFPVESAQTFFGANPYVVRNNITTQHEAIAGVVWLIAATASSLWGIIRTVRVGREGYLVSSWFDLLVLFAAVLVAGRLTVAITDRTSRAQYVPVVSQMQYAAYKSAAFIATHQGLNPQEFSKGVTPAEHTINERLKEVGVTLDRVGKLLDNPRQKSEDNISYARRLSVYFPGTAID